MSGKDSKCIACGSKLRVELRDVFDTRFGIENNWNIGRCVACGSEQTTPFPSPGNLKQLYETYYIEKAGKRNYFITESNSFLISSASQDLTNV